MYKSPAESVATPMRAKYTKLLAGTGLNPHRFPAPGAGLPPAPLAQIAVVYEPPWPKTVLGAGVTPKEPLESGVNSSARLFPASATYRLPAGSKATPSGRHRLPWIGERGPGCVTRLQAAVLKLPF